MLLLASANNKTTEIKEINNYQPTHNQIRWDVFFTSGFQWCPGASFAGWNVERWKAVKSPSEQRLEYVNVCLVDESCAKTW